MTPEELIKEIMITNEELPYKKWEEKALELIQQAKTEWCKEQRENCANKFKQFHEPFITDSKKVVYHVILNAPEP